MQPDNTTADSIQNENLKKQESSVNTPAQQETEAEINWRKFREQRDIDRKKALEAEKLIAEERAKAEALKAAMEALLDKKSTNSVDSGSNSVEDLTEDQILEKKVEQLLLAKERQLEEKRKQEEQQYLPQKLNTTYRDFDVVCSSENLDYLEYHHPEVANAFRYMPDGFDKWAAVYQAVKRYVPNSDNKKDQAKAEKNFNKPQSMTVRGSTSTGDGPPIMIDEKRKADNWARMERIRKGV